MKHLNPAALVAALLLGCGPTSILPPDKADSFARIDTGITSSTPRARVVELMGAPVEQSHQELLGISNERLTFKDVQRTYHVWLIEGRAVSKSVEDLNLKGSTP